MMKAEKIVYFIETPFCQRDHDRLGVGFFRERGFDVEVWDCGHIAYPNVHGEILPPDPIDFPALRVFRKNAEVANAVNSLPRNSIAFVFLGYSLRTWGIFRALSRDQLPYVMFALGVMPFSFAEQANTGERLLQFFRRVFGVFKKKQMFYRIAGWIFEKIPFRLVGISSARYLVVGGKQSLSTAGIPKDIYTEIVFGHSLDYDLYLDAVCCENDQHHCKNYILFLDVFFPHHPDFARVGEFPPIGPEEYYSKLCEFFCLIEKLYGKNIVIAEHPKSCYDKIGDCFQGRKSFKGKTVQLMRDASLILSHASTAMSFAALFEKKIIFFMTEKMKESQYGKNVKKTAEYFGKNPITVECAKPERDYFENHIVDMALHKDFIEKYICFSVKTKKLYSIVHEEVLSGGAK